MMCPFFSDCKSKVFFFRDEVQLGIVKIVYSRKAGFLTAYSKIMTFCRLEI